MADPTSNETGKELRYSKWKEKRCQYINIIFMCSAEKHIYIHTKLQRKVWKDSI